MIDSDKKAFSDLMVAAGEIYDKDISIAKMQIYFKLFDKHSIEIITAAFELHFKASKAGAFFPKPADILRQVEIMKAPELTVSERSELAWSDLMGCIATVGPYNNLELEDKQAMAVVKELGWDNLNRLTYKELDWKKKEFMTIYDVYENTPLDRLPKSLPGLEQIHQHKLEQKSQLDKLTKDSNKTGIKKSPKPA